jgi:hypothetical protein
VEQFQKLESIPHKGVFKMGKDTTNNVLFALGAIGSIIIIIIFAYYFATHYIPFLPPLTDIMNWLNILAVIFVTLAIIALYRETGSILTLLAVILFLIQVILALLEILNILGPFILSLPDPITAELAVIWANWIIWLLAFLLLGYSIWMRRDEIGVIATITGILFMIWGFIRLILRFLDYGLGPSIYDQMWFIGTIIIFLFALIYFIMEIRS